jgi:hypothetical protein
MDDLGHPEAEESAVGTVVLYGSVSVDGFIVDENDQPGPLFDWLSDGDVPLDESGELQVSPSGWHRIGPPAAPARRCPVPDAPPDIQLATTSQP